MLGSWVAKVRLERRSQLLPCTWSAADSTGGTALHDRTNYFLRIVLTHTENLARRRSRGLPTHFCVLQDRASWRSVLSLARLFLLAGVSPAVFRGSKVLSNARMLQLAQVKPQISRGVNIWLSGAASESGKSWVLAISLDVKSGLSCLYRLRHFLAPSWVSLGVLFISEILTQIHRKWSWCVLLDLVFFLVVSNAENHRESTLSSSMVSVLLVALVRLPYFFWKLPPHKSTSVQVLVPLSGQPLEQHFGECPIVTASLSLTQKTRSFTNG